MPVRALFDTNIFISYLLPSRKQRAINAVVEAAIAGTFTLLIPRELVEEFSRKVAAKEYLARRITPDDAAKLMTVLAEAAEIIPPISTEIPAATRDPKDDYLLAYALVGRADYLVTGDDDLLALGEVEGVRIVSPSGFAEALRQTS